MSPSAFVADPVGFLARLAARLPELAGPLRPLPLWAHGLLLAAGLAVAAGGARWRRPVALAGGAATGWLAGMAAAGLLELPARVLPPIGAALLAGAGLMIPSVFPFAAGALPGAFVGARLGLPGGPLAGASIGLLLLGGLGLLAARLLAAAAAGLAGGALAGLALLAASRHVPELRLLEERPVLLAALVLLLAVSGAAFQVGFAWGGGKRPKPPRSAGAQPTPQPQVV